ncbi:hypothetical protein FA13DRAFT_1807154 [Coprinellus micaceus]|uniref:Uncharacterized protein n=1 Tax=Coprinellus micaceus TaxID=71717 RepID=A0A4Y7RCB0_COPMI|nr:hypothetical protein FA13DRAFT_1807154 [Coprinellus micaceus]
MSTLVHRSPSKLLRGSSSRKRPAEEDKQEGALRSGKVRTRSQSPKKRIKPMETEVDDEEESRGRSRGRAKPPKSHSSSQRDPSRGRKQAPQLLPTGAVTRSRSRDTHQPLMPELPAPTKLSRRKKSMSPAPSRSQDVQGNEDDEFFSSVRKGKERAYSSDRSNMVENDLPSGEHEWGGDGLEAVEQWADEDDLEADMENDEDVGFDEEEDSVILAMSKHVFATPTPVPSQSTHTGARGSNQQQHPPEGT